MSHKWKLYQGIGYLYRIIGLSIKMGVSRDLLIIFGCGRVACLTRTAKPYSYEIISISIKKIC
jgi:hypothetical protein